MIRRPPRSTRTDTLFPYTTLFRSYGWPLVSWGRHYSGEDIPDPPTRPDLAPSIYHWTPVISPSGMAFYTGEVFPAWRGNLLIGGLRSEEHTSELQSLMRNSYAVFCLKKKKHQHTTLPTELTP